MQEVLSTRFWALEKGFFNKMHPLVLHRIATGRDLQAISSQKYAIESSDEEPKPEQLSQEIVSEWDYELDMRVFRMQDGKKLSRIPLVGSLTKNGGWCSYGSLELASMIQRANASKEISGIVMFTDGPGGAVSGLTRLEDAVRDSDKPIVSFVEEWAASAHYAAICQSDYIMGNDQEYTEVGSIGVLCAMMNYSEWLQKEGVKYEIKRAEQSVDKARLNEVEEWPDKSLEELQSELNMMCNDFISTVSAGRNLETSEDEKGLLRIMVDGENITSGKMYSMEDAIALKMMDYSGRLEDAVTLCADIAATRSKKSIVV